MLYSALAIALVLLIGFAFRRRINRQKLITVDGFQSIASAGDTADSSKLPKSKDTCSVVATSTEKKDYPCKHQGPAKFKLDIWGEESIEITETERCPTCWLERIQKYSIRCVLCGLPIHAGEAVAMYHQSNKGLRRDIGTKVDDGFLGCMRWHCCPSGAFFVGHWTGEKVHSAFGDGATSAELAFTTGEPVAGEIK